MKNLLSISLIAIVLLFSVGACDEDGDVIPEEDYTPFTLNFELPNADTVDLLAGQDMDIGEVQIWHDMENMYVKYIIDKEGWCLDTTHVHVAESEEDIPQNSSGNPKIGHFKYITGHSNCLTEYTDTLDDYDFVCDDSLVVAAHAQVIEKDEDGNIIEDDETAWGSGDRFTEPGNWATYFVVQCIAEWPASGTVSVAYEDLPKDKGNDYDYNDFVVDMEVEVLYSGDISDPHLTMMRFTVSPEVKTAQYNHAMKLRIDTFDCSGTYEVFRGGNQIESESFSSNNPIDVVLLPNTEEIDYDSPEIVSLEIDFDDYCDFIVYEWNHDQYHGENLFFDPYLSVIQTGEDIHTADVRMLTVPIDWQWPTPDQNAIWNVYPKVEKGDPPTFTEFWWED